MRIADSPIMEREADLDFELDLDVFDPGSEDTLDTTPKMGTTITCTVFTTCWSCGTGGCSNCY